MGYLANREMIVSTVGWLQSQLAVSLNVSLNVSLSQ